MSAKTMMAAALAALMAASVGAAESHKPANWGETSTLRVDRKGRSSWKGVRPDEIISYTSGSFLLGGADYRWSIEKYLREGGNEAAITNFIPFVDRYGQFRHLDWPGKIHSDEELRAAAAEEQKALAMEPAPRCFSRFGGWKDGPRQQATGRFRLEVVDGKWWFVDPEGYLFWSHGVVRVAPSGGTTPLDRDGELPRDSFFEWLPEKTSPFAEFYMNTDELLAPYYLKWGTHRTFDFSGANIRRVYGEGWFPKWKDKVLRRLRAWGLNTIANGSDRRVYEGGRTPYAERIEMMCPKSIAGAGEGLWWRFPDPWSREFRETFAKRLPSWQKVIHDPYCIGLYVDNELDFGGDPGDLARQVLRSPGGDQPAKEAMADWFEKRYGTWAKFDEAWRIGVKDRQGFLAYTGKVGPTRAAHFDVIAFDEVIADKYFSEVRSLVKAADPQLLYLGSRFAGIPPRTVLKSVARFCDAVSFNCYSRTPAGTVKALAGVNIPVLIGEFHTCAHDRGLYPNLVSVDRPNQQARADCYREYVTFAAENPYLVGVHWHQYSDQPFSGRFDGEAANVGMVTICDLPHKELSAAVREMGNSFYSLRAKSVQKICK